MSTNYHVSPAIFCTTWQQAETIQQVADLLGMPPAIAHARASRYRCKGVRLKYMPRPRSKQLDVDALNKLLEE